MNNIKSLQIEQIDAQLLIDKFDKLENLLNSLKINLNQEEAEVLLTREEVAKIFKVSLVTIWSWTNKGILKPYRIGNFIRYKKTEIFNTPVPINKVPY